MKDAYKQQTWFVKDVCGIICVIVSYLLLIFAQYVLITIIFVPQEDSFLKYLNIFVFEFFTFLAFAAHTRTMFTDPGAVPRGTATKEAIEQLGLMNGQFLYKCTKCCSIKPERAHHCSVCQRCIRKMDHHCPWVNNCVGENNQKFFVLFTFYIAIISIYALVMVFGHFVRCLDHEWKFDSNNHTAAAAAYACGGITMKDPKTGLMFASPTPMSVILLICLVFEGLLFAIFTLIMFVVQMQAIWNDETSIEQLKKETGKRWTRRQRWRSLRAVFGLRGFGLSWFSPFTRIESSAVVESSNYTV